MAEQQKSIVEMSSETRVIAARLAKLEPGQMITWEELGKLIGSSDRHHIASRVRSANRMIERDRHFTIATVRGQGVKRLADVDVPSVGEAARRSVRRKTLRAIRTMNLVEAGGKLDDVTMARINVQRAVLGTMALCTQPKRIAAVEEAVKAAGGVEIAPLKLLEMFGKPVSAEKKAAKG